ncbi:MAG: hypothetical protein MUD14_22225 [Hydrococcus sp. Prado102]|nr:hypothetical protein [Hydrococcus sp. Prado102]
MSNSDKYPFLSIALEKLFTKQEKTYGYFKIGKEDNLSLLKIPYLPVLKFYKNEDYYIYRAYWDEGLSPEKNLAVRVSKKQKKVNLSRSNREEIQKIYEVVIKYDSRSEIHFINKMLAKLILDRIEENLSLGKTVEEIKPLAMITQET